MQGCERLRKTLENKALLVGLLSDRRQTLRNIARHWCKKNRRKNGIGSFFPALVALARLLPMLRHLEKAFRPSESGARMAIFGHIRAKFCRIQCHESVFCTIILCSLPLSPPIVAVVASFKSLGQAHRKRVGSFFFVLKVDLPIAVFALVPFRRFYHLFRQR